MGLQVQPEVLANFTAVHGELARGSGFLARFLISAPMSTQGSRPFKDEPASWPALEAFSARVEALLDAVQVDEAGVLQLTTLVLGVAAKSAWVEFHDQIESELAPGGELQDVQDVASKTADNAVRLAACFHVFEHGPRGTIEAPEIESASQVITWHLLESRRFFSEKHLTPEQRDAVRLDGWLVDWCRKNGTRRITTRDIARNGPNPLRSKPVRDAALERLEELRRVRLLTEGKKWFVEVNPALLSGGGTA